MREHVQATPRKAMTPKRRAEAFLQSKGKCARCGARLKDGVFEVDHRVSLFLGGADELSNLECLCVPCHRGEKTPSDAKAHAKVSRIHRKRAGLKKPTRKLQSRPFEGWKTMNGEPVKRGNR